MISTPSRSLPGRSDKDDQEEHTELVPAGLRKQRWGDGYVPTAFGPADPRFDGICDDQRAGLGCPPTNQATVTIWAPPPGVFPAGARRAGHWPPARRPSPDIVPSSRSDTRWSSRGPPGLVPGGTGTGSPEDSRAGHRFGNVRPNGCEKTNSIGFVNGASRTRAAVDRPPAPPLERPPSQVSG